MDWRRMISSKHRRIESGFSQGRGRRCGNGAAQNWIWGHPERNSEEEFRDAQRFERGDPQTRRENIQPGSTRREGGRSTVKIRGVRLVGRAGREQQEGAA